ncbi:MAG: hypothetical protein DRJ10_07820 [Bacteroidetes bacterium]|nr:MAG: hypothetical protein DRJ10_07820 [Bacteroidota bacterium]
MSKLHFRYQQKKRKTWVLPLIVIVLLYVSIPFLLIQSGDEALKKAISETEKPEQEIPSEEYAKALTFLQIAEAFPGFTTWAKQIQQSSNEKMLNIYQLKCEQKSIEIFSQINKYSANYDSLLINIEHFEKSVLLNAVIFSKGEKENIKTLLPSELKNELETTFCDVWRTFFKNYKIDIPKNNSICNL